MKLRTALAALTLGLLPLLVAGTAAAQADMETLRRQVEEQRALIREQRELLQNQQQRLEQQAQDLDRLSRQLEKMDAAGGSGGAPPSVKPPAPPAAAPAARGDRDAVGDLNAPAVRAGDFPGSFRIPGPGKVSLALGGFVKSVAIYDSDAEAMGADFLPALLGSKRPDENGAFSLDATITRLFLDGRAPVPTGQVRGYVEYDLNNGNDGSLAFKLRHAYGMWKNDYGTLTAGQTWSTFMDLKILPEGLTEPTASGPIFQRQALLRWSQALTPQLTYHVAIEDPNSSDVFSDEPALGNTSVPDGVLGLDYDRGGLWHVRLNGLLRRLEVDAPGGGREAATAWGTTLTGHLNLFERDRLRFSVAFGEGLGRYLLGIQSTAGAAIDPTDQDLDLRKNWGGMANYEHHWNRVLRSTAIVGYARSKPLDWQSGDTFESSTYASANLMWAVQPYLTLGVEYGYGQRENEDGSDLDNHRVAVGVQVF